MKCSGGKLLLAALAAFCLWPLASSSAAGSLDAIQAKGEMTIGVKQEDPPFGFRNAQGELAGLEVELAQDLAKKLGVKLKPFPISAVSRLQFLDIGELDLLLATLAVTDHRKRQATLIEPYYFASSLALLTPPESGIASPADLTGKAVCVIQGAYYVEALKSAAPEAKLMPQTSPEQAGNALRKGQCAAFAEEDVRLLAFKAKNEALSDYRLVHTELARLQWAIAAKPSEESAALQQRVSDIVIEWHRSGKLLQLAEKWLGEPLPWLKIMQEKYQ